MHYAYAATGTRSMCERYYQNVVLIPRVAAYGYGVASRVQCIRALRCVTAQLICDWIYVKENCTTV